MLLILGVLLLTTCATVYLLLAQQTRSGMATQSVAMAPTRETISSDEEAERLAADAHRLITLLSVLLISALLILLFVLGAYLVIRVGQFVVRNPVGGKPTDYVDAWSHYRLTDEQISAATAEGKNDRDTGSSPPEGDSPPPAPDPDRPPLSS
jgi:hypothetical protein